VDVVTPVVARVQPPVLVKPGDGALDDQAVAAQAGTVLQSKTSVMRDSLSFGWLGRAVSAVRAVEIQADFPTVFPRERLTRGLLDIVGDRR
jgi:hypothetical protein